MPITRKPALQPCCHSHALRGFGVFFNLIGAATILAIAQVYNADPFPILEAWARLQAAIHVHVFISLHNVYNTCIYNVALIYNVRCTWIYWSLYRQTDHRQVNICCQFPENYPSLPLIGICTCIHVHRCSVLLPLLFSVYLDGGAGELWDSSIGCYWGARFVASVCYADDIALLALHWAQLFVTQSKLIRVKWSIFSHSYMNNVTWFDGVPL